jgi:Secretion system C-terminal sorting domain
MKNFKTTIFLLFFTFFIGFNSMFACRVDTVYSYINNSGLWENSERKINTYNSIDSLEIVLIQNWSNNLWKNASKKVFEYNTNRLLISETSFIIEWGKLDWTNQGKRSFLYNNQNQLIEIFGVYYNSNNDEIKDRKNNFIYNSIGNVIEIIEYKWNVNNWQPFYKKTLNYSNINLILDENSYYWNSTSNIWNKTSNYIYTYDSKSNLINFSIKSWDEAKKIWLNRIEKFYEYNSKSQVILFRQKDWDMQLNKIETEFYCNFSYDNLGNRDTMIENFKDTSNNQFYLKDRVSYKYTLNRLDNINREYWRNNRFVNGQKYTYYYNSEDFLIRSHYFSGWNELLNIFTYQTEDVYICSPSTTANQEIATNEPITIYPNPTNTSEINIKSTEKANYTLMDLSGKVLDSGNLNEGNNTLQLNSIQNGMYILKMNQQSFKIVVNK